MIKITDNNTPVTVDFKNSSNSRTSGTLLTYEISGEACVQVGSERIWVPFSNLSDRSREKILGTKTNGNNKNLEILKDAKLMIITTLMTLIGFFYYYLKFSL